VITSPAQIVFDTVEIVTVGTTVGFTVITTELDVTTLGLAQPDELVISTE
jgi:hypothetical protein